ncbi:MAG: ZIP family metal transporter [Ruminococcaceae bacterium]|nr:ZIP family metal transporter [Oscillospiraceae bacterium]
MWLSLLKGILLPLAGTSLGAACVFFMKKDISQRLRSALIGFAAGVMIAASVWSLIIPAIEASGSYGKLAFLPATVGFWAGIVFLLVLDHTIPHIHLGSMQKEGLRSKLGKNAMLVFTVSLHNIPEGMAVGAVYAGLLDKNTGVTLSGAIILSLGIAVQNFPEGAIISMPLASSGMKRGKAFFCGFLSGAAEPIAALLTVLLYETLIGTLPYMLAFAAGAMIYVVIEELVPEISEAENSDIGTLFFALGFSLMMVLDVSLG